MRMLVGLLSALVVAGALQVGPATRESAPVRPAKLTRRTALFTMPALAVASPANAGQVGGAGAGGMTPGTETLGGGPPKISKLAPLTKGEPGMEEMKRLAVGYQRLQYLLNNWEKCVATRHEGPQPETLILRLPSPTRRSIPRAARETTVCIKGCKGPYEGCGCLRDPIIVQSYMGYKSMEDPLFRAGDLMLRASSLVKTDDEFEKYTIAMEKWNNQADE